ncbi:hypothetical protein ACJX0J_022573, partial [Zea mays]
TSKDTGLHFRFAILGNRFVSNRNIFETGVKPFPQIKPLITKTSNKGLDSIKYFLYHGVNNNII